ncbi:4-nitrophenylphosphatase [Loa loa]|uniref:4-nitrophenylphosphatase n=1 Tax=Loa loa TaxID=7209 RepID=A0A1I7VZW1_LOALO|nr:4-nitrophenylphosphatase [Loa loa]EFO25592.1 4-nitrophenylphosphatase [Loa loa]
MSRIQQADSHQLINLFDSLLFDADGVLWLDDTPLPGAADFLRHLVSVGKNVFIVTNNSTKTLDDYAKKCRRIGFDMISDDHILSPAKVLAHILAKEKSDLPVYIVGSSGLQRELKREGIESFGTGPDPVESYTSAESIQQMDTSRKVRAVVVSFDIHISYPKIMRAATYINQPGVRFYATNPDPRLPGPIPGVIIPGSGVSMRAVQTAADKEPILIGKPSKTMFEYIKEKFNLKTEKSVIFGDSCETDIKFANVNGLTSVLVGTGVHNLDKVGEFEKQGREDLIPTYYTPSLKVLFDMLQK